jgi:hypothetical protein
MQAVYSVKSRHIVVACATLVPALFSCLTAVAADAPELKSGSPPKLQVSLGYRWFRADHHFVGNMEQKYREREHSQTINSINLYDVGIAYNFTSRFRMTVTLPLEVMSRSQVVRDSSGAILDRFTTQTAGLRDLRLTIDEWLRAPEPQLGWNAQVGFGVVIPTGNDAAKDVFEIYDNASGRLVARQQPVDTSIQPGSGGWGLLLKLTGFARISDHSRSYFDASYIITPQDTNGVLTHLPNPYEAVISIADSYLARLGVEYRPSAARGMSFSLGARLEGVPVHDLVGASEGFRRPGYIVSVEPSVSAPLGRWSLALSVPVAVHRNRLQSVADQEQTAATGIYQHGDVIYPNFSIICGISKRW